MSERRAYGLVALLVVLAAVLYALRAVLFAIGIGLAITGGVLVLIALVVVNLRVFQRLHVGITEARKRNAEAALAEESVTAAQLANEERRVQVATAQARIHLIPDGFVGAQLGAPEQASLYHIWTFKQERSPALATVTAEPVLPELSAPALPGPTDLSHLLGTFRPSPAQILLALTAQGMVTCSLEGVSHVALAAPTGGGKSSLVRMLLGQILACGVVAYLADPHFTPIDPKSGEDWRMIAARLAQPPYTDAHIIKEVVAALVVEMRRRYALREQGKRWGAPCYLAIDEWPAILSELDKQEGAEIVTSTGKLLRQGRKVDIHLITSSQDFLVETIGGSGEIRTNLRTAYFAGGGLATARALLDQQIKLPETPLGKGVVLLRSEEALPTPTLVRVPYASNEALYRLLPIEQNEERYWAAFPPLPLRQSEDESFLSSPLPSEAPHLTLVKTNEERKGKEESRISRQEREAILTEWRKGTAPSYIHKVLRRASNYYYIVQQVIAEEQERLAREEEESDESERS